MVNWRKPHTRSRRRSPTFETWHGTRHEFEEFDPSKCELGVHSGSLEQASSISRVRLVPLEVTLENPVRLEDTGTWHATSVWEKLMDQGIVSDPHHEIYNLLHRLPPRAADNLVRDKLVALGYDGIVYLNRYEGLSEKDEAYLDERDRNRYTDEHIKKVAPSAHDSYIVFDPCQIKRRSNL